LGFEEWVDTIRKIHEEGRSMPIVPLIGSPSFSPPSNVRSLSIECAHTMRVLAEEGVIRADPFGDEVLKVFLDNLLREDQDLSVLRTARCSSRPFVGPE